METTATYDKDAKEFIVNTPNPLAQKYWITNGACHAHHIIVFAQLYIDGVNQGWDFLFSFQNHFLVNKCIQVRFYNLLQLIW